eukprot:scaffold10795_cov193-Alexandrium_tamarense.AAC.10
MYTRADQHVWHASSLRSLVIQTSFFLCSALKTECNQDCVKVAGMQLQEGSFRAWADQPTTKTTSLSKATASFQIYIRTMDPRERDAREKKQKQTRELLDRAYDRVVTAQLEKLSSIKTFTGEELEE